MFQEIGIWCVAIPVAAMLSGLALIAMVRRVTPEKSYSHSTSLLIILAWCAAVAIALGGRQSWDFWPEDFWRRSLWPIAITSSLLASLHHATDKLAHLRWPVACIGSAITARCIMPNGEGWEDILPLIGDWMLLVTTSSFVNIWALYHLSQRNAQRWVGLVAVTSCAAPLFYALGVYAGLAEIIAAAMVATLVASVVAMFARFSAGSAIIYPASLFAATATASTRFYSYEEPNPYVLAIILFLPTAIAAVDFMLASRSQPIRIVAAALIAVISLGFLGWFLNPEAETEEW